MFRFISLATTLSLLLTANISFASENDCFMDYQDICGKVEQNNYQVFMNQCELQNNSAKAVDMVNCQQTSDQGRTPASTKPLDIFQEVEGIELEMSNYLNSSNS